MQVDIGDGNTAQHPYVSHFRAMWTAAFSAFLRAETSQDFICFAPELLAPEIYYARTFEGREESDRWQQSLVLARIAKECLQAAREQLDQNA
ncbi:MAG: hypothetical protein ACYCSN_04395 [Acidobacteriaceae bacterium]